MAKLKLSVIVPPRPSGPVNSLYPTQQHSKERRFLIIVAPSTTVGELYSIVLEKYQNTYLHGHDRNDFWIEKLQDGNELDLTQDIVLGEFLDDTNAIHVIRVIQGSLDRSSSIPQASSLRPKGFIQERFSGWETSSRKRRKLDDNARGYVEAHPDQPRPTTELHTSEVHQAPEVPQFDHPAAQSGDADSESRERASGSVVSHDDNDRMSVTHNADTQSKLTSVAKEHIDDGDEQHHVTRGKSSAALMPPPKVRPAQRVMRKARTKSSEEERSSSNQEEDNTAPPEIAIRNNSTRGRNLRNIFEVPASDTEQPTYAHGSAEPQSRRGKVPDMFTKVPAQTTPSVEAESSPRDPNVGEASDSINKEHTQQPTPRDASVTTSAKALKRVREYRRFREESSDRETLKHSQRKATASRSLPPKKVLQNHEPLISDPIESSGAASPTAKSAPSVDQIQKRSVSSIKPSARKPTRTLHSAPVSVTRPGPAFNICNGPDTETGVEPNTNHLVIAASEKDIEGYLAAKRLSLQARIEENDRRRIQDSRSPKANRQRQESEKKALRYFQQFQDSQVPTSPLSRRTRNNARTQSKIERGDQDGLARSMQDGIIGQVSNGTEHPRIRPSQELTPMSEPTTRVIAESAQSLRSNSGSLPAGDDMSEKAVVETTDTDRDASATGSSNSVRASPMKIPTLVPFVMIPDSTNNSALDTHESASGNTQTQAVAMTPTSKTAHSGRRITRSAHALGQNNTLQRNATPQTNAAYVPIAEDPQLPDIYPRRATSGPSKTKAPATDDGMAVNPAKSAPGKLRRLSDKARTQPRQGRLPFIPTQDKGKQRARIPMKAPEQNAISSSLASRNEQDPKSSAFANGRHSFRNHASSTPALVNTSVQTATKNDPEVITSGSESSESSSESEEETQTRDTLRVNISDGKASVRRVDKDHLISGANGRAKSSSSTSGKGIKESGPIPGDSADDKTSLADSHSPLVQAVRDLRSVSPRPRTESIGPVIERSGNKRGSIPRQTSTQPRKLSVSSESTNGDESPDGSSSLASSAASSTRQRLRERNHARLGALSDSGGDISGSTSESSERSIKAVNGRAATDVPKGRTNESIRSKSKAISSPPPSPQFRQRHASPEDPQQQSSGSPHSSSTSSSSSSSSASNDSVEGNSLPTDTSALHARTTPKISTRDSVDIDPRRSRSSSHSSSSSESSDSSFSSHASDEDDAKLQSDLAVLRAPISTIDASMPAGFAERKSIAAKARMLTSCMYKPLANVFLSSSQAQEHHHSEGEREGKKPWWDVPSSPSSEAATTSHESLLGEDSDDPGALDATS